jgi:hypothetical protein
LALLKQRPSNVEQGLRLAEIAGKLGELGLRQAALGAAIGLGHSTPEIRAELESLGRSMNPLPKIAIEEATLSLIVDPQDRGPVSELFRLMAPVFTEAVGPELATLGVSKKDRVKPSTGLPVRNEIAAWAGALGLGEFDLYVGGKDDNMVVGVAMDNPTLVIGSRVTSPLSPEHRQRVAGELLALKRGTSVLGHRSATEIAALVAATCRLGQVVLDTPKYAMLDEFERQLSRHTPRKVKKLLPAIARDVAGYGQAPLEWAHAAWSTLDRFRAMAVGDVSWLIADLAGVARGEPITQEAAFSRVGRLLGFVFSPQFQEVRQRLGLGGQ